MISVSLDVGEGGEISCCGVYTMVVVAANNGVTSFSARTLKAHSMSLISALDLAAPYLVMSLPTTFSSHRSQRWFLALMISAAEMCFSVVFFN